MKTGSTASNFEFRSGPGYIGRAPERIPSVLLGLLSRADLGGLKGWRIFGSAGASAQAHWRISTSARRIGIRRRNGRISDGSGSAADWEIRPRIWRIRRSASGPRSQRILEDRRTHGTH